MSGSDREDDPPHGECRGAKRHLESPGGKRRRHAGQSGRWRDDPVVVIAKPPREGSPKSLQWTAIGRYDSTDVLRPMSVDARTQQPVWAPACAESPRRSATDAAHDMVDMVGPDLDTQGPGRETGLLEGETGSGASSNNLPGMPVGGDVEEDSSPAPVWRTQEQGGRDRRDWNGEEREARSSNPGRGGWEAAPPEHGKVHFLALSLGRPKPAGGGATRTHRSSRGCTGWRRGARSGSGGPERRRRRRATGAAVGGAG